MRPGTHRAENTGSARYGFAGEGSRPHSTRACGFQGDEGDGMIFFVGQAHVRHRHPVCPQQLERPAAKLKPGLAVGVVQHLDVL